LAIQQKMHSLSASFFPISWTIRSYHTDALVKLLLDRHLICSNLLRNIKIDYFQRILSVSLSPQNALLSTRFNSFYEMFSTQLFMTHFFYHRRAKHFLARPKGSFAAARKHWVKGRLSTVYHRSKIALLLIKVKEPKTCDFMETLCIEASL